MKMTRYLALFATLAPLALGAANNTDPQEWQKDWAQFGSALTEFCRMTNTTWGHAEGMFEGKEVEWTGMIAKIDRGDGGQREGRVDFKMPEVAVRMTDNYTYQLREVSLTPKADEWTTWKNAKAGDTVTFRARFKAPGSPMPAIVAVLVTGKLIIDFYSQAKVSMFADMVRKMDRNKTTILFSIVFDGGKLVPKQ